MSHAYALDRYFLEVLEFVSHGLIKLRKDQSQVTKVGRFMRMRLMRSYFKGNEWRSC